jgi:hypothetical protein
VEDFLLLGEIPGTTIVITFDMWLLLFSAIFMLGALLWLRRRMELLQKLPALLAERIAL